MKVKDIIPVMNDIITTAEKQTVLPSGLIVPDTAKSQIKPVQTVVAIGPHVVDIEVGDKVEIDPMTFPKHKTADAKHDVGPDTYEPLIPLYVDSEGEEFLKIKVGNILWKLK